MKLHPLSFLTVALAASCGYTAPYHVAETATPADGVHVHVAGQLCYVNRTADQFPTSVDGERLHVALSLQVANASAREAQVSLNEFHLSGGGGPSADVVMTPRQQEVVVLPPGATRTIGLDFEKEALADCSHELVLDTHDAVALGGSHPDTEVIRFQPAR
jgi:hypothetical protein